MHGTGEDSADYYPYRAGKESELGGKDRPDERPGSGYRREMMAEKNPFIRRMVIMMVI
jgi:hypothetical protein